MHSHFIRSHFCPSFRRIKTLMATFSCPECNADLICHFKVTRPKQVCAFRVTPPVASAPGSPVASAPGSPVASLPPPEKAPAGLPEDSVGGASSAPPPFAENLPPVCKVVPVYKAMPQSLGKGGKDKGGKDKGGKDKDRGHDDRPDVPRQLYGKGDKDKGGKDGGVHTPPGGPPSRRPHLGPLPLGRKPMQPDGVPPARCLGKGLMPLTAGSQASVRPHARSSAAPSHGTGNGRQPVPAGLIDVPLTPGRAGAVPDSDNDDDQDMDPDGCDGHTALEEYEEEEAHFDSDDVESTPPWKKNKKARQSDFVPVK
jgi:hypothetical protein